MLKKCLLALQELLAKNVLTTLFYTPLSKQLLSCYVMVAQPEKTSSFLFYKQLSLKKSIPTQFWQLEFTASLCPNSSCHVMLWLLSHMTGVVWTKACSEIKLTKQGWNALFQAELLIKQEGTGLFWLNSYGITWQELFGQRLAVKSSF